MEKAQTLTKRENEIVHFIVLGKDRKYIADHLKISINTIDSHIRNIHIKTKTHSLSEVIVWFYSTHKH
jgi:DNA-binding CsgD family transcriptional regulator